MIQVWALPREAGEQLWPEAQPGARSHPQPRPQDRPDVGLLPCREKAPQPCRGRASGHSSSLPATLPHSQGGLSLVQARYSGNTTVFTHRVSFKTSFVCKTFFSDYKS